MSFKGARFYFAQLGFLLMSLSILLLAPAAVTAAGVPLDHTVLQLKWTHQFQFAGYYAAVEKGFYRDAGLNVELREATPGKDPVAAVLDGAADFGVGSSELALLRDAGKPVVVLATIYQHSPLVLLVRSDSGIRDLQQLAGHPIMIEPGSAELYAYFKDEGIEPSWLRVVAHTFDVNDLINHRADAMSAYSTDEPFLLKRAGINYLTFTPRAGGIDFYGDNIFTTEGQIAAHPQRVRRFREASLRGWEYAMAHPKEIVDLILRKYNRGKGRAHLMFEAAQSAELIHPELIELGHTNPGRWRHIAETYARFGMMKSTISFERFLYDPNPLPDLRRLYWSLTVASLIAIAALCWVLPLVQLNRKLRRAKEAAELAERARARFVAIVTHEVRQPIGVLVGYANLLASGSLSAEQREYVDEMLAASENLLSLINNVLDYSKFESGSVELESLPLEVEQFARRAVESFRLAAAAKGIGLRYTLAQDMPRAVLTDPTRLQQIVTNLLSNAIKFTVSGTVEVAFAMPEPGRMRISVTDTGPGIAPQNLERIFTPYAQADASVSRQHGGTGLGLSISKRLAELMGGGISITSTLGAGSTFSAELAVIVPAWEMAGAGV